MNSRLHFSTCNLVCLFNVQSCYYIFFFLFILFSCKMGVPGKTEGTIFSPIPCEVTLSGPERVGGEGAVFINETKA